MASDLRAKFEAFDKQRKELLKTLKTDLRELFKAEVFDKYPQLKSFAWIQYTPYFADGDPCEFSAYTDAGSLTLVYGGHTFGGDLDYGAEDDEEYEDDFEPEQDEDAETPADPRKARAELEKEVEAIRDEIADLLAMIPQDFLQATFDDHSKIIVSRKGFSSEDYSHD